MGETRRRFLMMLAAGASCTVGTDGSAFAQTTKRTPFPLPPPAAEQQNPAEPQASKTDAERAKRAAMQQNEKDFRADVARLYELASDLKQDVEKLVTTEVFSLQMYRRTEEIEKVAKQLKVKAKGQ